MTTADLVGLAGIVLSVGVLVWLAYRGFSLLLAAPAVAMLAAAFAGDPLLANFTQTFMGGVGRFIVQFFPLFLLGAVFGKLMQDSGSALAVARLLAERLGGGRAIAAIVLACAVLTYGGVSLFVVAFVVFPVADALFREAGIPRRLMPAAIALGSFTFTMIALPGTPAIQNAIPMPHFGTTIFAAPGIGILSGAVMLAFGLWWLQRAERAARGAGEGYGADAAATADPALVRERAIDADVFDPAELAHGQRAAEGPSAVVALTPVAVVLAVNMLMTWVVLPQLDTSFLAAPRWGGITLASVSGIWSVITALVVACLVLVALNLRRLTALRDSLDAGATASVLPIFNTASLAGFGAVIAALPAFAVVRDGLLAVPGGPLLSMTAAIAVMSVITASASAALIITLDALGDTYVDMAAAAGIDPALMHRVASIACGSFSLLPHNGAVVTLLSICGTTQRQSFRDIAMVGVLGPILALAVAIALGKAFGSF
jgi:H+/gluconate symporter-like permease